MKTSQIFPKVKDAMMSVGLSEERVKKEVGFAAQQIQQNKQLQKSTIESNLRAVINVAYMGLTLNPAQREAYLTPRWNKSIGSTETVLMPSYGGLQKLAVQSGNLVSIICNVVHENDTLEMNLASADPIRIHLPSFKNKGEIIGAYAIAVYKTGQRQVEWMDREQLDFVRECSDSYKAFKEGKIKDCIWEKWHSEMCRKTVLKRLCKYLVKSDSPSTEHLSKAIEIDNTDFGASLRQKAFIDVLLMNAVIGDEEQSMIENSLESMSYSEAKSTINYLKNNQVRPLDRGNMSMAEINEAVKEKLADERA